MRGKFVASSMQMQKEKHKQHLEIPINIDAGYYTRTSLLLSNEHNIVLYIRFLL